MLELATRSRTIVEPQEATRHAARIALVITELSVGGAERCLVNVALRLDPARFEPQVYSLAPRPPAEKAELVTRLEGAGVPVHFLDVRHSWQLFTAIRRLRHLLRRQSPHLLQSFLFHANVVGTLAARGARVPTVVQGIRVADPRRWRLRLERRLAGRAAKIVCVSESVAEFARVQAQLPSQKLMVIPNGVEVERYPAAEAVDLTQFGLPGGRRVILYVGRLDQQKGVDWMLQFAPVLLEQLPDHDLLLVGNGPLRESLRAMAGELGIADRVHFAGWRPDVPGIMRSSDLLVLPSRWEGMPNVLLEAMATSLPVVSTRVAGVAELLGPLAESQTASPGDAEAFIGKIVSIARDSRRAELLGRQNRQRVAESFHMSNMIAAYARLYDLLRD